MSNNTLSSWEEGLADLDDLDAAPVKQAKEGSLYAKTEKYPCEHCNGTGSYSGVRVHQEKEHCFACRGKGFFLTSLADRRKARQQRKARVEKKGEANLDALREEHPGLIEFLEGATWSEFAQSILAGVRKYGSITEKQLASVSSMIEKCEAREKAKQEERKKASAPLDLDLDALFDLFNNATGSGLKRPRLTINALTISRAPDHGRNAGCLYLKWHGEYVGKITCERELALLREAKDYRDEIIEILSKLAQDPLGYAQLYGQETGVCCCCNRELTDPDSIAAGIGPICQEKWGL